ncbi:MAG: hypothetical protein HYU39_03335 [Thaumarchaeota archaeon]|nr:hypothetical protein [Nitrososphaerota archaeon]
MQTVSYPDAVYASPTDVMSNFAAVKDFDELARLGLSSRIVVHYRETTTDDAFMLTAFPNLTQKGSEEV